MSDGGIGYGMGVVCGGDSGDVVVTDTTVCAPKKASATLCKVRDDGDRASECGNIAEIFSSKIIESINALWEDLDALRSEVRHMKTMRTMVQHDLDKLCLLYVRVVGEGPGYCVDKSRLELLDCTVLHYVHLTDTIFPSLKVKISDSDVHSAIAAGVKSGCFVARWNDRNDRSSNKCIRVDACPTGLPVKRKESKAVVKISCWNYHGLFSSLPYLHTLLDPEGGSKIVVLAEHWLWPYDLHKLKDIHKDYDGKSNSRLTEDRCGVRGCGEDW